MLETEISAVVEIHVHEAQLHDRTGNFCSKAKGDAFLGLNMDDEAVGFEVLNGGVAEKDERSAAKLDNDFRSALREAFAGTEIERNASPAPIVDL